MKPIATSLTNALRAIATSLPGVERMHIDIEGPGTRLHLVARDEAAVHALAAELGLGIPREASTRSCRWLTAAAVEGDLRVSVASHDTPIEQVELDEATMGAAVEQARAAVAALRGGRLLMHHRRHAAGRRTCDLDGQNPAANAPGHEDTHDPTCVDCTLCIAELKSRRLLPESHP